MKPWVPDNEETIPKSIRHLCEPTDIAVVYSAIGPGQKGVVDHKTILGIKLDFGTEPGREMWEKVERYLDRVTPRDRKVPEPVMMAPNQKSEFNPTIGRRSNRGSMEFAVGVDIPDVDLRTVIEEVHPASALQPIVVPPVTVPPVQVPPVQVPPVVISLVDVKKEEFALDARSTVKARCDECKKDFKSKGIYAIHMKRHKVKEKVGV